MKYESYKRPCPITPPDLTARPWSVRVPYQYDADKASLESGLACRDGTRTQQQFKDECDINTIAKNFGITGRLPENIRAPQFGDFTDVGDYQGAVNAAQRAMHSFMQLPAETRYRFENNPQLLLEFCANPHNRDEAVKLGLVDAPPVPASVPSPAEPLKPM